MYQKLMDFLVKIMSLPIKLAYSLILSALVLAGCNPEPSPYVGDEAAQPSATVKPVKPARFLEAYRNRALVSPTINTEKPLQNNMMHGMENMQ